MAEGEGLLTAFRVLLDDAPADRAQAALKIAIKTLVDTPRVRLGNRSPTVTDVDKQRWTEVKGQLRQYLAKSKVGMSIVARETELPLSSVQRSLSPAGPTPGRGIISLLSQWLDQQHSAARPKPAPASNGTAAPAVIKVSQSPAPARIIPYVRAGELTRQQREALAGYLALDPSEILHEAGVSRAAAEAAVAGEGSLDPKVITRLVRFLNPTG